MVCRSKGLTGGVRLDHCFAIADRLCVDDAVKPVLDSGWKLDRLLGRNFTRERIFLSHTLNDILHSQADSEEL
jgi:hypothetical protein